MTTEVLIGIQILVVMLLVIGMLILLLRRQQNTIQQLKAILTDVKDDISGNTLVRHFQLEIDNTTAHCRQETVALKADLPPEDMAISLRFSALQTELALIQDRVGTNTPWREQIKNYEELAQKIHELIRARVDHATRTLNDSHNQELAAQNGKFQALQEIADTQLQRLKQLQPMQDCIEAATSNAGSPQEIEQKLHKGLLAICENYDNTEMFRELTFLLHEAFNERATFPPSQTAPAPESLVHERKPVAIDPSQNMEMLNNIINKQNETIRTLRSQIDRLENTTERNSLNDTVDAMQEAVSSTEACVQSLHDGIEFQPPADDQNAAEMHKIIEKFTEESATMVERIHLLSNENKQLMLENEHIRTSMENGEESGQAPTSGLKLKIEKQNQEIIELQQSCKELEEKYLSLYSEKITP